MKGIFFSHVGQPKIAVCDVSLVAELIRRIPGDSLQEKGGITNHNINQQQAEQIRKQFLLLLLQQSSIQFQKYMPLF